jgi:nicotinamide-nucleotide amidase
MGDDGDAAALAERIAAVAVERGVTVAAAESLTGGLVASRLAAAPEASDWFRGAIVAYSRQVKYDLLGVPVGPVVSEAAARRMAVAAADLLGGDLSVAVTGAGGPEGQDGQPPGTVWVAVYATGETTVAVLRLAGNPAAICRDATIESLRLLLLHMPPATGRPSPPMR